MAASAAMTPVPSPPQLAAKSYLLLDINSGRILAAKNIDEAVEPASITKLMTAYIAYHELDTGRLSLNEKVTMKKKTWAKWRLQGSTIYLQENQTATVEELLKGVIILSGNDATVALAEHIAGNEEQFVDYMNQYAQTLAMNDTRFINSTGWPHEQHLTTAKDIATLAKAIITEFPEHYKLYAQKEYTFNEIRQYNRNKLLWRDKSVDGLKTGHTESAGFCLVASAQRKDMRLLSVVLGTKSEKARADVSQSLLSYGFRFYESNKLYGAGESLNETRVWLGEQENLSLGLMEDLHVTIPRGHYKHLDAVMDVNKDISAPVKKGQQMGTVRVMLNGEEILTKPLVALQTIEEGSFWQRTRDHIIQLFQ
ncbi:MAG: D-alanyl-D-alanine carboxypeptidase [Gammaproteobacteria bacterium]|nr:D-alanyl-D-alanine carboxypeptidase [Gammaproteobacteria bacterium]